MREKLSDYVMTVALVVTFAVLPATITLAQAPATSVAAQASALRTPWGEPDLQGIWTD